MVVGGYIMSLYGYDDIKLYNTHVVQEQNNNDKFRYNGYQRIVKTRVMHFLTGNMCYDHSRSLGPDKITGVFCPINNCQYVCGSMSKVLYQNYPDLLVD